MGHQGLRDWAAVAGKTSQTGGGQCSRWQLTLESFEVYKEKGAWEVGGGSGEGSVTFSCQDCVTAAVAELITVQNLESH